MRRLSLIVAAGTFLTTPLVFAGSLAMVLGPEGQVFAYYGSLQEARTSAQRLGCESDLPIVAENKSSIRAEEKLSVNYFGKPYCLQLEPRVNENNFFPPDEGLLPIMKEMNKVTNRIEYDLLPQTVFKIDLQGCVPARAKSVLGKTGEAGGNCFNFALYLSGKTSEMGLTPPGPFQNLVANATPVTGPPQNGDVGVLYDFQGTPVHAFTVFEPDANSTLQWVLTKNGTGELRPYQLQRMDETLALYPESNLRYYRFP